MYVGCYLVLQFSAQGQQSLRYLPGSRHIDANLQNPSYSAFSETKNNPCPWIEINYFNYFPNQLDFVLCLLQLHSQHLVH